MIDALATGEVEGCRWWLAASASAWSAALEFFDGIDTYHLKAYHDVAGDADGAPFLFLCRYGAAFAALPFVRRPLVSVRGGDWPGHADATSVYGYPGLLTTAAEGDEIGAHFAAALKAALRELGIVSIFVRQNPLFDTEWLWDSFSEVRAQGSTVLIDLQEPIAVQRAAYRKGHRWSLSVARRLNLSVRRVDLESVVARFSSMYTQTMKSVGASEFYLFSDTYFERLAGQLGDHTTVFEALIDDNVCGAVLLLKTGQIAQYHLGAWNQVGGNISPVVPLIDAAGEWARAEGCRWFHLGGGVGGADDSLLRFKRGFSKHTRTYKVVRAICDPEVYKTVCEANLRWRLENGFTPPPPEFFPPFRAAMDKAKPE